MIITLLASNFLRLLVCQGGSKRYLQAMHLTFTVIGLAAIFEIDLHVCQGMWPAVTNSMTKLYSNVFQGKDTIFACKAS